MSIMIFWKHCQCHCQIIFYCLLILSDEPCNSIQILTDRGIISRKLLKCNCNSSCRNDLFLGRTGSLQELIAFFEPYMNDSVSEFQMHLFINNVSHTPYFAKVRSSTCPPIFSKTTTWWFILFSNIVKDHVSSRDSSSDCRVLDASISLRNFTSWLSTSWSNCSDHHDSDSRVLAVTLWHRHCADARPANH